MCHAYQLYLCSHPLAICIFLSLLAALKYYTTPMLTWAPFLYLFFSSGSLSYTVQNRKPGLLQLSLAGNCPKGICQLRGTGIHLILAVPQYEYVHLECSCNLYSFLFCKNPYGFLNWFGSLWLHNPMFLCEHYIWMNLKAHSTLLISCWRHKFQMATMGPEWFGQYVIFWTIVIDLWKQIWKEACPPVYTSAEHVSLLRLWIWNEKQNQLGVTIA